MRETSLHQDTAQRLVKRMSDMSAGHTNFTILNSFLSHGIRTLAPHRSLGASMLKRVLPTLAILLAALPMAAQTPKKVLFDHTGWEDGGTSAYWIIDTH